jgi:hypothetical protein
MTNAIFGSRAVAAAAGQLYAAAKASTREQVEERLERFLSDAGRSEDDFETAFLAAQMLRDLGKITPSEAAHVFDELVESARGKGPSTSPSVADFHRSRGEVDLARLIDEHPIKHECEVAIGSHTLISHKPISRSRTGIDTPASIALVSKHVLALVAREPEEDRRTEWNNFVRAFKGVSTECAVRVVQGLREASQLTHTEHASLVDAIIGEAVDTLFEEDEEISRLHRAAGMVKQIVRHRPRTPDQERESQRRLARVKAAYLRRLGEHELANLLLADMDAYAALVEASLSARIQPIRGRSRRWQADRAS